MTRPRLSPSLALPLVASLLVTLLSGCTAPVPSDQEEPAYTPGELAEATRTIRSHYYDRAWELGTMLGEEWSEKAPGALELRAWHALNLAQFGEPQAGVEVALDLLQRAPDDPWSWFAMAGSLARDSKRSSEAPGFCEKALSLSPHDVDFLSLEADVLRTAEGAEAAIAFIDSLPPEEGRDPLMLMQKAEALERVALENRDEARREEAYDLLREIAAMDSTLVEPLFFLGIRLRGPDQEEEGLELLRRATALSPACDVHQYYWRVILAAESLSSEEKKARVESAMKGLLDRVGETPGVLLAIASTYESLSRSELRDSLWNRILTEYPESQAAERVLVDQYRAMSRTLAQQRRETGEADPELTERYRGHMEEFLMRPVHHVESLQGDAFQNLMILLSEDEDVDPEILYSVIRGVELHAAYGAQILYGRAPLILAERQSHLDYAEALARQGIEERREEMERMRGLSVYQDEEDYQEAFDGAEAAAQDVLGQVLFAQGRLEDAERVLLGAYALSSSVPSVLLHLGQIYEERYALARSENEGDGLQALLDQAQDFYVKGSLIPIPGENPNDGALRTLYERRNGSLEGLDELLLEASAMDADARKERILSERMEEPKTFPPFQLATMAGEPFSSEELAGKVAVINFWGTWCGPCVMEMPGFQKLFDQYRDDPDVLVLSISNDEDPEVLRQFMEKEAYTFPVLLDDEYVGGADVHAFPTTWFVGPEGTIQFEKIGWTEELAQEFGWRVEALRESG